jgi:predicted DNA-binding transcriptional regulator YafY
MSKYDISRRLQFILQFINDRKYVSKESIINYLAEKDIVISNRTLERDFENIKSDFGIELGYNRSNNGYYIDEEKSIKVNSFFKFLELATLTDVFRDGLKDSHKIFDYVSFDDSSSFKGIENLEPILIAIKQGRKLKFTHYSYYKKTKTDYSISPLILKEYINRWYLIGVPDDMNDIRTFGIDRLSNIKITTLSKIKKRQYKKELSKFDKLIGLYYSEEEPQKIVLKVNNEHLKYLESLPLHQSQKIIESEEPGFGLAIYNIIPNYEFTTELLKMSIEIEVLEPKEYRDYFKKVVKDIYMKYDK